MQCDWGYFGFIVMDEEDPDHRFSDGYFAYAYLGGPFLVMTYNNGGYGPERMDEVMEHETGHIFGAPDEYSQGCEENDCTTRYGFLHVFNANCVRCNPNPELCVMRANQNITCYWTEGHIGWHDYDGDLWNDAPDRNSRKSINIWDVYPGDFIELWDIGTNLYKVIFVTPDNSDIALTEHSVYVWECTDYDGNSVVDQNYLVHINGSYRTTIAPESDYSPPILSNISAQNGVLYFTLYDEDTAGDITRIRFLQSGQEVYRPVFDKFLAQGLRPIDISSYTPGIYQVEIRAWDAGGNAAAPLTGNITLLPQTPTGFYVSNNLNYEEQYQNILIEWDPVPAGVGIAAERSTIYSGWSEIGRVVGQDHFEDNAALGSEYYIYRIRSYFGDYYSDYTTTRAIRAYPQFPLNFQAYAGGSNRVKVLWDSPTQQLPEAITVYWVSRKLGSYSTAFGPYLGSPAYICSDFNTSYVFGVRTHDIYGHHSIYTKQDVTTGSIDNCQITPNLPGHDKDGFDELLIPERTVLFQNAPNPFNSTTLIRYGLDKHCSVAISIYDISGRLVKSIQNGFQQPGFYSISWDGQSQNGETVSSGLYFCLLTADGTNKSIIMSLLK
jgi:hypothetical protein